MRKFLNKYWGWCSLIVPLIYKQFSFYFPMIQVLLQFYKLDWIDLQFDFVGVNNYKSC